jgi:hypothetical protein
MEMAPESKVWIYQANRALTNEEVEAMKPMVQEFAEKWIAHGKDLLSQGTVLHNHFVVLMVDESRNPASGCSIDTSTRFIRELELRFNVKFFDRLIVALWKDDSVRLMHKDDLLAAIASDEMSPETLMFNNLVMTKKEFEDNWMVPVNRSWLARFIPVAAR